MPDIKWSSFLIGVAVTLLAQWLLSKRKAAA